MAVLTGLAKNFGKGARGTAVDHDWWVSMSDRRYGWIHGWTCAGHDRYCGGLALWALGWTIQPGDVERLAFIRLAKKIGKGAVFSAVDHVRWVRRRGNRCYGLIHIASAAGVGLFSSGLARWFLGWTIQPIGSGDLARLVALVETKPFGKRARGTGLFVVHHWWRVVSRRR